MITYTKQQTLLKIEGIKLSFGSKVILNDVNAEVKDIERDDMSTQGQVVCFLGASGIGKTRLARLIACLDEPTAGTITLANGIPTKAGLVGFVQQNYPLFSYMTAMENLLVAAKMNKNHLEADGIVNLAKYCDQLSISDATLKLYPKQLSGGQRQRVAIIRQLLCSEHLLILDEPFSGLDIKAKQQACKLISDVAALDTLNTIIIITHDVTEGLSVADQAWLMGITEGKPGASIVKDYDLAAMGFAWQPDIQHRADFMEFVRQVKDQFLAVAP